MSQTILNQNMYARTLFGVINLSDGVLEIENGNITNANSLDVDYLNSTNIDISGNLIVEGNFNCGLTNANSHIVNGKMTFNTDLPECGLNPTTANQLVNKNYTDTNFVYKTGSISETITGIKTFSSPPENSSTITTNSQLTNKLYVDTKFNSIDLSNYVTLNSVQIISGNKTFSGNITASGNVVASGSEFSYTRNLSNITVQNYLWTDGSGVTPTTNSSTFMLTNVRNQTVSIQGWTMVGTTTTGITGYDAQWVNGSVGGYNEYGGPPPSGGNFYCLFRAYSSGSTPSNSTFYVEAPPTLDAGMYLATWQSTIRNGTVYSSTSLTVSLGAGSSLLSYNDVDLRAAGGTWRQRSLIFEVKTPARLRWTFRDTQATSNRIYVFAIGVLTIQKYNGIKVADQTNNAYLTGSLAQLNNVSMNGANQIVGSLNMTGIPSFYTARGSNNIGISTSFTNQAGSVASSNNIVMGTAGTPAVNYTDNVLIGNELLLNTSLGVDTLTEAVVIGNRIAKGYRKDVLIGADIRSYTDNSYNRVICIGNNIFGGDATSTGTTVQNRTIMIGSYMGVGYFSGSLSQDNVIIGHDATRYGTLPRYNYVTGVGNGVYKYVDGNETTFLYNTALGFESGTDPLGPGSGAYREPYRYCTLLGSRSHTGGNIANIEYATCVGYNASSDASYCTVIGADATYNIPNTIRLGRTTDKTVVSSLQSLGNADITGNVAITGNVSISGNITNSLTKIDGSLNVLGIRFNLSNMIYPNQSQNSVITGTTTISTPYYEYYSVSAGVTAFTISLPFITIEMIGKPILFRRVGGTTTTVVSFLGNSQNVYNTALTGGTTPQGLMGSGVYIVELIPMTTATVGTYAWFQV